MSQKHLYGESYVEFNPPDEWEGLIIESTTRDNALGRVDYEAEYNFSGQLAKYVIDEYLPTYGACNGLKYRIQVTSDKTGLTEVVFDGYIDLLRWTLKSLESYQFSAPIRSFDRLATVFDRMSIVNQGFLRDKGFITNYDFVDIPVIRESKTNIAERKLMIESLMTDLTNIFLNIIQNVFSSASDILGASIPVGILETISLFAGVIVQLGDAKDLILAHKDLLFPHISYYKGMSIGTVIEKAFQYLGMSVDFGEIDAIINKMYLFPTQNGFDGYLSPGVLASGGQLKPNDFGYFITDLLEFTQGFFNGKQTVVGNTIHIKSKNDPYWNDAPDYEPLPILNETTRQYGNGTKSNYLDDFYATWYAAYKYDALDPWTLTEKNGDSYEIHRELNVELDPRTNCLHGLKDLELPYAMAVRKNPIDDLWELFVGVSGQMDTFIAELQDKVESVVTYYTEVADSLPFDLSAKIDEILTFTGISTYIENRTGCLKMQDNVFSVPKLLYMTPNGSGKLRIPENFKEYIGASAIYNNYYIQDSPADVNDFQGQRIRVNDWQINFTVDDHSKTNNNENTEFEGKDAKFLDIAWDIEKHIATTDLKVKDIFDTNITETEIE